MALEPPVEEEYPSLEHAERALFAAMRASEAMLSPESIISVSPLQYDAAT